MYWSAEETVLAVTGALLLVVVAASFAPAARLTSTSRVAFAIGAVVLVGSAFALSQMETVRYPLLLWLLPAVPLVVIGVVARDAITGRVRVSTSPGAAGDSAPHVDPHPATWAPSAAGGGPGDALHARAADPRARPDELATIAYGHPHLRATVATNPATPASVLEWLAALGDPAVHAAIASRATPTP